MNVDVQNRINVALHEDAGMWVTQEYVFTVTIDYGLRLRSSPHGWIQINIIDNDEPSS